MKKRARAYGQYDTRIEKQALFSALDLLGCDHDMASVTDSIVDLTGFDDWYAGKIARRYLLDRGKMYR